MSKNKTIKACLFDLDGVLVDTAIYHFKAWRRLANELGFDFTHEDNEKLKGVSRVDSLNLIIEWGGVAVAEDRKPALMKRKNDWYLEYIEHMNSEELLPGVVAFFDDLKANNIQIGLGSASKNAVKVLEATKITHYFATIIDGTKVTKGKPDPETFERGAKALGLQADECIVFEDAVSGIAAARDGGFYAVGVGDPATLKRAHLIIQGFPGLNWNTFKNINGSV